MIDFNLNVIEALNDTEVRVSAGPEGALGQASRALQPQDLAILERIQHEAESIGWCAPMEASSRDLARAPVQSRTREEAELRLEELGRELFDVIVRGEVREVYERARSATLEGRDDVLLVLVKLRAVSSLQRIPWELLHDGYRFLAKDPRSAVVRYFEQTPPIANLEVEPPLRVLITSATPKDQAPLAFGAEEAAIHAAYEKAGPLVEVCTKRNISIQELERVWRQAGNEGRPFHVWHHCGHGGRKTDAGPGEFVLYLEMEQRSQLADVDQLQEILGFCPALRIAVFNVCHGGSSAGIVPALARLNVPVVIGFQRAVRDAAAVRFAAVLHEGLLHIPVEFAVSQARSSLKIQRVSIDWIHALAFSRRRDRGPIFGKLARGAGTSTKDLPPKPSNDPSVDVGMKIGKIKARTVDMIEMQASGNGTLAPNQRVKVDMEVDEIEADQVRQIGYQLIEGFTAEEVRRREARIEALLEKIERQEIRR